MTQDIPLIPQDDGPGRADARRNHQLLLETAQHLFAEHGVNNVSMTAIAEAAHVGKGTLYRHFTNKAALCNALLDEEMHALQVRVLAHLRDDTHAPFDKLVWFMAQVLDFVTRNESLLIVEIDGRGLELDHRAHYWWRQTLIGLLQQLRPDDDVRYHADVLYVMLDVRTLRFQQTQLGYPREAILDGLTTTAARLATPT